MTRSLVSLLVGPLAGARGYGMGAADGGTKKPGRWARAWLGCKNSRGETAALFGGGLKSGLLEHFVLGIAAAEEVGGEVFEFLRI